MCGKGKNLFLRRGAKNFLAKGRKLWYNGCKEKK